MIVQEKIRRSDQNAPGGTDRSPDPRGRLFSHRYREAFAVGAKAEQSPLGKAYRRIKTTGGGSSGFCLRAGICGNPGHGGKPSGQGNEEKRARVQQAYAILSKIVEKKPFFVVTMCTDGEIFDSALDAEKITAPCGNVHMLQCSRHILEPFETAPLYEKLEQQIEAGEVFTALPRCPACGGPLHPNTICTEGYLQDAYLPSWPDVHHLAFGHPAPASLRAGAGCILCSSFGDPFSF